MRSRGWCLAIAVAVLGVSAIAGQQPAQTPAASTAQGPAPLHIYIRSGLKSHGPGLHDYPQYLADWSKVLTERGAIVDGSLHFPTAAEIATTDVIVMYKGDAGGMSPDEKATLDAYLKRGGGLVSFHDTLCGPDPDDYSAIVGGAKKHGQVNYTLEADMPYTIVDTANPIMQGMSNFTINDEAFFLMTWAKAPAIKVLATATIAADAEREGARGGSGPADLDLRAVARRRPAVSRVRLDAGAPLRELRRPADSADAAARDRVGGQAPGGRADDRAAAARRARRRVIAGCAVLAMTLAVMADAQQPAPANPAAVARGRQAFGVQCAPCHGPDGRGGLEGSTDLTRSPIPLANDGGPQLDAIS